MLEERLAWILIAGTLAFTAASTAHASPPFCTPGHVEEGRCDNPCPPGWQKNGQCQIDPDCLIVTKEGDELIGFLSRRPGPTQTVRVICEALVE